MSNRMRRPERSVADRIHDAEESYRRAPLMNARRAEPDPAVFFASLPAGTVVELREHGTRVEIRRGKA